MKGMTAENRFGINGFQLKMIAMITMLTDHIGAILFPQYMWMRIVGRLAFPIFAFLLASFVSFVLFLTAKPSSQKISPKKYFYGVIIGVAFGFSNLLNTICAGKLKSTVFFPLLNVSTILFSVISGVVIYKEKITCRDILVFLLGALAIVMISR